MTLISVDTSIASICSAQNNSQLVTALASGLSALGFQTFIVSGNKSHVREFMTAPTLTNWSTEDLEAYHRGDWSERDPLLELAGRRGIRKVWKPVDWSQNPGTRTYSEYLDSCGIRVGVTAALVGKSDRVSAITALSFSEGFDDPTITSAVAILGQTALTKAATLGLPSIDLPAISGAIKQLSGKQLEILAWARQGKSNRDIATIIGVSTRSIDYHMSEILRKLGVTSRAQAIVLSSG